MRAATGAGSAAGAVELTDIESARSIAALFMVIDDAYAVPARLATCTIRRMSATSRRVYIDWARGLAVLLMIEAHTIDAWTRPADKQTLAYSYGTMLGGMAAPLFLWLAGLGVVLSATRTAERTGSRGAAVCSISERGLEIFLLAFLFRLQAFVVSPGSHPVTLFRVDVLNVMGPAMVAAGLIWAIDVRTPGRVIIYSALAAAIALVTPLVRAAAWVGHLPLWLQWYLRPA